LIILNKTIKNITAMKEQKKTPLPQKFSHLQFGDRLDEYIGLVSYRVNCHLNIVVPKKTPKIYLEPY